ncbi:hypothetical protein BQ8794_10187 [Mesorhizobium prunaredense]|uniref:PD(D/E)XK endonuclease domain-containing protein n=1 Tax=Mesorhizobium prunaredense TaxID=1631249 RepID=A0A1R3UZ06_9HYPH|nr:hypothetical protein [Mesorhizobium prunaredense]SIT52817.1 hypothetical protein BQ8794_10187 [Mesorhizobium prunaredense]
MYATFRSGKFLSAKFKRCGMLNGVMIALKANEIEAANRAEVTALLIRCGYRVYRPEADVYGEDLVIRTPEGHLIPVQLKGRLSVDFVRYGGRSPAMWMLFPDQPYKQDIRRDWFLVPHDRLFDLLKSKHGHSAKWRDIWNVRTVSRDQRAFLDQWKLSTLNG